LKISITKTKEIDILEKKERGVRPNSWQIDFD